MDIYAEALNVISSPGSTLFSFSVNLYGSHTHWVTSVTALHLKISSVVKRESEEKKWIKVKIK